MMFVILYLVFAVVFKVGDKVPNYPIYLLTGVLLWGFFAESTQNNIGAIVHRGDLIQKIKIKRVLIIVATSLSSLVNLALSLVVLIGFAVVYGIDFQITSPLLLFYILEIYVFALGLSLFLSVLFVRFRDVIFIWDVVLQAGFYATPVLYPVSFLNDAPIIQKLVMLNPVAHAIQGARKAFVTPETLTTGDVFNSVWAGVGVILFVVVLFVLGALYFKSQSKSFAERL